MDGTIGGSIVRAVASFMLRLAASLLGVLMVKFDAHPATARQKNLEAEDLDAVQIVVISQKKCGARMTNPKICTSCKGIRNQEAKPPRNLIRLPVEVTQDKIFSNRGIPLFLCEHCDEQELKLALAEHEKRLDNK